MANKLTLTKIVAVALCKQGCNPDADIMLYKSLDEEGTILKTFAEIIKSLPADQQALVMAEVEKAKTDAAADVKCAMDEALEKPEDTLKDPKKKNEGNPFAKAATLVVKMQTEITSLKETVAKSIPETGEEDIWKGINPAIKKMFEDSQAKAAVAEGVVKSLEDEKVTKSYIAKAAIYKAIPTSAEELGSILKSIGTVDVAVCDKLEAILKATNEMVSKGKVFKEFGTNKNTSGSSAWATIEGKAADMVTKSADGLTKEQAIVKISRAEPELYAQYLQELKGDDN